jgi:hypothetical protein
MDLLSPECSVPLTFWSKYYIKLSILPMFLFIMGVVGSYQLLMSKRPTSSLENDQFNNSADFILEKARRHEEAAQRNSILHQFQRLVLLITPTFVVVAVTLYTFMISTAVEPFNCMFNDNGSRSPIYVMVANPSQRCYDSVWLSNLPIVVIFTVFYGLCFPSFVAYLLYSHRSNLEESRFARGYGPLFQSYRRGYYFWELVLMIKRATFVLVTQFTRPKKDLYVVKFSSCISIVASFSALEAFIQPYSQKTSNLLNTS